jgi:hypothetical protein
MVVTDYKQLEGNKCIDYKLPNPHINLKRGRILICLIQKIDPKHVIITKTHSLKNAL